jgi:uncharacterized repeat protein (TIGR02543 family)
MQRIVSKVLTIFLLISLLVTPKAYALSSDSSTSREGQMASKIVGGDAISISLTPWQVALISSSAANNYAGQFCGGSIISSQWILTAAHCVDGTTTVNSFRVLAGQSTLSTSSLSGNTVQSIVIHPAWNDATDENDIALVRLTTPLTLVNGQIEAIAIPSVRPANGQGAFISGWGSTYFRTGSTDYNLNNTPAKFPTSLMGGVIGVASDATCLSEMDGDFIQGAMICGGTPTYLVDACQGDSGGPLVTLGNDEWFLSGISSWGYGCAWDTYGVYTNVANYKDWIAATSGVSSSRIVSYDTGGGSTVSSTNLIPDGFITTPQSTPTLTNYVFSGWSTSNGGSAITFPYASSGASNVVLYARWVIDPVYAAAQAAAAQAAAAQAAAAQAAAAEVAAAEVASRTIGAKGKFAGKALAQRVGLPLISPKATVTLKVSKSSKKVCAKSGNALKTLGPGNCIVSFTIQEPKVKGGKKPAATRVDKIFVVR